MFDPTVAALLDCAGKATILLIGAAALHFTLRQASAAARHLLWTTTLVCLLLLPVLEAIVPKKIVQSPTQLVTRIVVTPSAARIPPAAASEADSVNWILWIWAAGAALVALRILTGMARVRWIQAGAEPVDVELLGEMQRQMRIGRTVRLLRSGAIKSPMTTGVFPPVILIPENATRWTEDRLRVVIAHELGHIQRQDWMSQMLSQIVCALYWFHPLVWWADRQLGREREHACDDAVLRVGIRASDYAGHLVELARAASQEQWSAALPMAQRTTLEARLRALLSTTRRRGSLTRRSTVYAAVLAACLLLPLAAVRSTAQGGNSTLFGTVYDVSGAVVPNARINLTNLDGKNRELTTAGPVGEFRFNGIPGGHYVIEVRQPGFELFKSNSVDVQNGASVQADVRLRIGGVNEAIEVVADTPRPAQRMPQGDRPKRIRVGGSVQATKLLNMVRPIYPEAAKQAGIEGAVLIRAVIALSGDLLNAEVVSTSNSDLAAAALDAVRQWKYQPTLLNGEPVEVITTIAVNFKLKN